MKTNSTIDAAGKAKGGKGELIYPELSYQTMQELTALKATGLRLGILVNFGTSRVESIRIVN